MRSRCVLAALVMAGGVKAQSTDAPPRQSFPLQCRGGGSLVFDTLLAADGTGRPTRLMLTFVAADSAAGETGQRLAPGTCAWVDRPLNAAESRRVEFSIGSDDSAPDRTVADSGMYWSFLAHSGDAGRLTGVAYRHWHASLPPLPHTGAAEATASQWSIRRFDVRYLPLIAMAISALLWVPMLTLLARWSGWQRLAQRYPDRNARHARSFRSGPVVMHRSIYRGGVRLTLDDAHVHFAAPGLARPAHRPFSVPWSDITLSRDEWPWFPLKGHPMVRLTLAGAPDMRILIKVRDADRIAESSGGRLALAEHAYHAPMALR